MPLYRHPQSPYWWCRFSIGGLKVRRSTQTTERAAAEEFETKLRADLWRQIKLGERPRHTWKEAVSRWHSECARRSREQEHERLKWFSAELDELPLADVSRDVIDRLRAVRLEESSPSTTNRYMAGLRIILRKAEREWGWIDKAPTVPMYPLRKAEPRFLTRLQFGKLLKQLPPHLKALAEFSVETGLRMRNATGLAWDQVDLRRRQLIIPASSTKAGETIAIPMSARALAVVKAQRGKDPQRVFTFNRPKDAQEGVPQEKRRRTRKMVDNYVPIEDANGAAFKKAAKRAGVAWLRWHDLRHTWASWHIQAGTPPYALQELGGWQSQEMVKRYAHLSTEHLRAFAEHRKGTAKRKRVAGKA